MDPVAEPTNEAVPVPPTSTIPLDTLNVENTVEDVPQRVVIPQTPEKTHELTVAATQPDDHSSEIDGSVGLGPVGLATIVFILLGFLWKRFSGGRARVSEASGSVRSIRSALSRTRAAIGESLDRLLGQGADHPDFFEEVEMLLLAADIGMGTVDGLLDELRDEYKEKKDNFDPKSLIKDVLFDLVADAPGAAIGSGTIDGPHVILVVGVNGSGKTTTIGKLAASFTKEGKKVVLAAADTYRAAASEQLEIWAKRAGAEIVQANSGADPAAVAFDAVSAAVARHADVVLIDTAGRLQTAKPLMEQLSKIGRVIQKVVPNAPHETLLVLDGTMGQNGLSQARLFNEATPISGVIVTKLDGTAKGGMIFTLADELALPVKMIGVGEKLEDLRIFEPKPFVDALF